MYNFKGWGWHKPFCADRDWDTLSYHRMLCHTTKNAKSRVLIDELIQKKVQNYPNSEVSDSDLSQLKMF